MAKLEIEDVQVGAPSRMEPSVMMHRARRVVAAFAALGLMGGRTEDVEPAGDAGADGRAPSASVCDVGEPIPPWDGPPCLQDTHDCLRTCEDPDLAEECTEACLAADPDCRECLDVTLVSCVNESCQAEWDAFACCTERECADPGVGVDRQRCVLEEGRCTTEVEAHQNCSGALPYEVVQACGSDVERICNF